jgi:N4-gp56 family major capsid protein
VSDTTLTTSHDITAEQFAADTFRQYLDQLVLTKYMGTDSNALIQVREELAKGKGDAVTINLMAALSGAGITGDSDLETHEEAMLAYGQRIVLNQYKNAVRDAGSLTKQRAPFDLLGEFRPALTNWLAQKTEDLFFDAAINIDGATYGTASESTKDAWLVSNTDRVLFGAATGNNASNDHSAALSQIDSSTDVLNTAQISLAKRLAQLASPRIRPIRVADGQEFYVMFVHPYCARDFKSSVANAQMYAMPAGLDNPLFTGALGAWDGVLIVESPKVALLDNVGGSSIDVAGNFLCGAQAFALVQGAYDGSERIRMVEKTFDYGSRTGVAIMSMMEVSECRFNSKQHGIVRCYSAAVGD